MRFHTATSPVNISRAITANIKGYVCKTWSFASFVIDDSGHLGYYEHGAEQVAWHPDIWKDVGPSILSVRIS